jgi:hypothetical protein
MVVVVSLAMVFLSLAGGEVIACATVSRSHCACNYLSARVRTIPAVLLPLLAMTLATAAGHPAAPRCPPDVAGCRAAQGRVIALQSVDPDGDGDLHLILASSTSITLPGVTVLDISKRLRPKHDPRIGDWAAGAGPVQRGSYRQRQIHVITRVAVDPRR